MTTTVTAPALRQFSGRHESFRLVVDEPARDAYDLAGGDYRDAKVLGLPAGTDLAELLAAEVPDGAHVLVVCPDRFLASPGEDVLGDRQLAVLPAGSTPLTARQVRHFLAAAELTDVAGQAAAAARFFDAVERTEVLRIVDPGYGTEAVFRPAAADYAWNQQAGPLEPGEQQIVPAGELSVLPVDITDFDADACLAVTGTLALRGWPIVHRADVPADLPEQAELFAALRGLAGSPVVVEVDEGVIQSHHAVAEGGRRAAAALEQLFSTDPRYRTLWELGFGINAELQQLPENCGPNEVYGGPAGAFHLGVGLTPWTRWALTFSCPGSAVTDAGGTVLLGGDRAGAAPGRRRLSRRFTASCGCH
jgi:hypothetical protein